MKKLHLSIPGCLLALSVVACGENETLKDDSTRDENTEEQSNTSGTTEADASTPADLETQAILDVKAYVAQELAALHAAAKAIQSAAPAPDADGWNSAGDEDAVAAMREAWKDARDSYERIEGAIAVLFPNYDASTDERYDGFIEEGPDENLFDGEGVTGVHAIERILWAEEHPEHVVDFESALPNYAAAAFPASEDEATEFVEGLTQRLMDDTKAMVDQFKPLALDPPSAFRGVIGSMEEQIEKLNLAATGEDESRYAQYTLGDMRANAAGGREIFEAFIPQLRAEGAAGRDLEEKILEGFDELTAYYADIEGDAIPEVPSTWNADDPSEEDLDTPYGKLYAKVSIAADPEAEESLVKLMLEAAELLEIAEID